mmetsp:Transcript_19076/g.73414  ORF Transcript_19076/g.73414 Transcript_19076/m.73414 type:complete len:497 (+) Transcript_19076:74-1564(+)
MTFSFGATTPSTGGASSGGASSGFSFGGATSTTPASGAKPASSGFSFGSGAAAATPSTPAAGSSGSSGSTGGGFSFGAGASTPAAGGSAGAAGASSSGGSSSFSFGAGASTPAAGGVSFMGSTSSGAAAAASTTATVAEKDITFQTQFDALPASVQKGLFDIQVYIQKQEALSEDIAQQTSSLTSRVAAKCEDASEKLAMLRDVIRREQLRADEVNGKVRKQHQVADAQERLLQRLGQPAHLKPALPATLPSTYFYDLSNSFQQRMQLYKDQIEEIEQFLSSSTGPSRSGVHDASILAEVVQNQSDSFIAISAKVAEVHEALNTLKNLILQLRADNPYAKNKSKERKKVSALALPPATPSKTQAAGGTQLFGSTSTPSFSFSGGGGSTTPTNKGGSTFSFGGASTPAASTPSTFSFGGTPSTPAAGSASGGTGSSFNFGASTPSTTGSSLGGSTPTTSFSFGGASTPAKPATGGSSFSFGATPSTPAGSSFGSFGK